MAGQETTNEKSVITYDDQLRDLFLKSKINYKNIEFILNKLGLIYQIESSNHLGVYSKIGLVIHKYYDDNFNANGKEKHKQKVIFTLPADWNQTNIYIINCSAERIRKILTLKAFW